MFKKKNSGDANSPGSVLKGAAAKPSSGTPSSAAAPPGPAPNSFNTESSSAAGVTGAAISHPQPVQLGGSGLLLVRVVEARNLVLPNGTPLQIAGSTGGDITKLPYIVIDFDKNEILVSAKEGNAASKTVTWGHRAHFDVSREAEVTVSVYQRGTGQGDILLGSVRVKPLLVDGKLQDQWYPLQADSAGGDQPKTLGEMHLQFHFKKQTVCRLKCRRGSSNTFPFSA